MTRIKKLEYLKILHEINNQQLFSEYEDLLLNKNEYLQEQERKDLNWKIKKVKQNLYFRFQNCGFFK